MANRSSGLEALANVDAFLFDVFGTVVDWQGSVAKQLEQKLYDGILALDWIAFVKEWREGYTTNTKRIASGGEGTTNIDELHLQILNDILAQPRWEALDKMWDAEKRAQVNTVWHTLDGWPDSSTGLHALKKHAIIGTLSNGNVRLLVDMAKHADLPWDVVFAGELLGSYKPNPKTYLTALHHLSLSATPARCALVASHIYDLRAAAQHGYTTVYVRRTTEDLDVRAAENSGGDGGVRSKSEGGEVDLVVDSLEELAEIVAQAKSATRG